MFNFRKSYLEVKWRNPGNMHKVTLRLLFKPLILSFVYCIIFFRLDTLLKACRLMLIEEHSNTVVVNNFYSS